MENRKITQFEASFISGLPETFRILESAGLVVHPSVSQITLHGSRGLAGHYRPDSDIDLSLLITGQALQGGEDQLHNLLDHVLQVTLSNWQSAIPADLAAVFPLSPCGLTCFQTETFNPAICSGSGVDCFGIYKIQKGFSGFVRNAGIRIERMYPLITIWKKDPD